MNVEHDTLSHEVDLDKENYKSSTIIYSHLAPRFIRTLKIKPKNGDSPFDNVECNLEELSLSEPAKYMALSYVWGPKENPGTVKLNGEPYVITQNLLSALKHFRALGYTGPLWVDALCINQVDIPERDSQVQQMTLIYEQASLVIAWLGLEADDSSLLFSRIKLLADHNFDSQWFLPGTDADTFDSTIHGTAEDFERFLKATKSLFKRSYWNRLWVMQEIAFAKEIMLCCGSDELPLTSVLSLLELIRNVGLTSILVSGPSSRLFRMVLVDSMFQVIQPGYARERSHGQDAVWLLALNAVTRDCGDPRDRIYGCRGLFSMQLRDRIPVDYEKQPEAVILDATRSIIEITGQLQIILVKTYSLDPLNLEPWEKSLPSWAPQLDAKTLDAHVSSVALDPEYALSASRSKDAKCQFLLDGSILRVRGIIVGQITRIEYLVLNPMGWISGEEQDFCYIIRNIFEFQRSLHARINSHADLVLFWSTIFGIYIHWAEPKLRRGDDRWLDILLNHASEMERMHLHLINGGISLFSIKDGYKPIFTPQQAAFLQPFYIQLVRRVLFCFERALPDLDVAPLQSAQPLDMGVCPDEAQEGDLICVLYGCKVPVVLRPKGKRFRLVGDAYLSHFMDGEALKGSKEGVEEPRDFELE